MAEKQNSNPKLEGKLVETLKIEGLGDLTQEYAELGIDLITDDGFLKDIPIVGTLVKTTKAIGSVRTRLYLKKLICFLQKVGETTQQQREKFIEDNCQDTKQFEEAILLILEQADNMNKSALIGKIFKACILGKILYEDATRLSEMVNRAFWGDLEKMFNLEELKNQEQRLFLSGLFDFDFETFKFATTDDRGLNVLKNISYKRNCYAIVLKEIHLEHYEKLGKGVIFT